MSAWGAVNIVCGMGMAFWLLDHWPGFWRYLLYATFWPARLVYVAMDALAR